MGIRSGRAGSLAVGRWPEGMVEDIKRWVKKGKGKEEKFAGRGRALGAWSWLYAVFGSEMPARGLASRRLNQPT